MTIKFTKMHGLGNDFMVIDGLNQRVALTAEQIAKLADRHTGIGFDQCLLIEPSKKNGIDFNYRIFNADGHEVGQCGNGARCLAIFVKHHGLTAKNSLKIATSTTEMILHINDDNTVTVDMTTPELAPEKIPFIADLPASEYRLELDNETVSIHAINVGNPHALMLVSDVTHAPVAHLGPLISHHTRFPEQVNVGFMQILNSRHMMLRVYERGCGETRACGSGAVAAAAAGRLFHKMDTEITVTLPGGDLIVNWPEIQAPIQLTGPAILVYDGQLLL